MDVSKLAPYAKTVVAVLGSVVTMLVAGAVIASTLADGVMTSDDLSVIAANILIIATALGLPVVVYQTPNKK
jgi:hypothetical protein